MSTYILLILSNRRIDILPKYIYFKLHDPVAHKYNSTLEYKRDLVKRKITLCKDNINSLNLESRKIREKLVRYL